MSFASFLNDNSPFKQPVQNEQKNTVKIEELDSFTRYSDAPKFKSKRPQFRIGGPSYRRNKQGLTVLSAESLESTDVNNPKKPGDLAIVPSTKTSELLPATYSRMPSNSMENATVLDLNQPTTNDQTVVFVDDANDRVDNQVIYKTVDLDRLNYDTNGRPTKRNSDVVNEKFVKELPINKLAKTKPYYARAGAKRLSVDSVNRYGSNKIHVIQYDNNPKPANAYVGNGLNTNQANENNDDYNSAMNKPSEKAAKISSDSGAYTKAAAAKNSNKNNRRLSRDERRVETEYESPEKMEVRREYGTKQGNVKFSEDSRANEKAMIARDAARQSEYERIKRDKERQWANLRIKSRNGFRTYYDDEADVLGIQCFTCLMSDCKRRCGRCGGCADLISCPTYCWICFILPLLIMIAIAIVILCLVGSNIITG